MYLGVDYYPEHWPKAFIDSDLDRIVKMNGNMIRIGEFAWHLMEQKEGDFDFSFFDHVIEKAKKRGIAVMFGTPTATFPAWLATKYPDILSEDNRQTKRGFGGRRQYCYNSDVYNTYAKRITRALVAHYQHEPAVVAWQIDNEFGHEGSDYCYCQQCEKAFRVYLQDTYKTIDALNEAYGTIFWGQTYNTFDEIPLPKPTITVHNPSLRLDHDRFRSESLYRFAKGQIDEVRLHKGDHQEVTHNFSGGFFEKAYDQSRIAKELDFVSYDNYPVWGGLKEPLSPAEIAMTLSYARGLKGDHQFWIVEQLMGAQGHDVIGYLPRPNQAKLWAYQAFAQGCQNMLFFRYRGMDKGAEQFCYGIIDQDNEETRKYREVQAFFSDIKAHEEALKDPLRSDVAVVYDYDNIRSWSIQTQSLTMSFNNEVVRVFEPFHSRQVPVDVIPSDRSFDGYKVIVFPVMQILDQGLVSRIEAFVQGGGQVLFTFRTGLKDRNNNIHFGCKQPGLVSHLVGAVVSEIESLQEPVDLCADGMPCGQGHVFRELLSLTTAKGHMTYADEPFKAYYAFTENQVGQGHVFYLGTGGDKVIMGDVAERMLKKADIPYEMPNKGIERVKRGALTFEMNHDTYAVKITQKR